MTDQERITLGELARQMDRIEANQAALSREVRDMIAPLSVLSAKVKSLEPKVERIWWDAAFIAGGIAGIGFVLNHFWKP